MNIIIINKNNLLLAENMNQILYLQILLKKNKKTLLNKLNTKKIPIKIVILVYYNNIMTKVCYRTKMNNKNK